MSDLYQINDILQQKTKTSDDSDEKRSGDALHGVTQQQYKSDVSHAVLIGLFVKAIDKVLIKIRESLKLLKRLKSPIAMPEARDANDTRVLAEFVTNLEFVDTIIVEFNKAISVVDRDTPTDVIKFFETLHKAFAHASIKNNLFIITKKTHYGEEMIQTFEQLMQLFKTMQQTIEQEQSSAVNICSNIKNNDVNTEIVT